MVEKLLVTGGMGFIGSNFIQYMLDQYPDLKIINLDKLTYASNPANLADVESARHQFVKGDVCDKEIVDGLVKECDAIVHFAAETHVDRSIEYAEAFVNTDVRGTFMLLEAARKHGVERFIHISTDEVYGEAEDRPSSEDDPLMPKSPYAASKAGADRLAYSYFCTYGLPVIITRCTNNYGPYQYPEKLIPLFTTNALQDEPLPVYGSGENTRDWIYVKDHCSAIDVLLNSEERGEVFNIGSGEEKTVLEIASLILSTLNKPESLIEHVEDRAGHVERHAVDTSKIRDRLSWKPDHEFDQAMVETIQWYKDNKEWWHPIKSGEFKEYYEKQYDRG